MNANELLEKVRELLPRMSWSEIDEDEACGPACVGGGGDGFVWLFVSQAAADDPFVVEAYVITDGVERDQVVEDWLDTILHNTSLRAEQPDLSEAIAEVRFLVKDLEYAFDERPPEPF